MESRKRSQFLFRYTGKCKFSDCPIKLSVKVAKSISDLSDLTVIVNFTCDTVKQYNRESKVNTQSSSTLYNELIGKMDKRELKSEKRGQVISVFKKKIVRGKFRKAVSSKHHSISFNSLCYCFVLPNSVCNIGSKVFNTFYD